MPYSWLTIHRARFPEPRNATTDGAPPGPATASAWRFGPHAPIREDGLRTGISDTWGGVGFYETREAAEALIADPAAHLDWLDGTVEHWHALAGVIAHRGEADWSTGSEPHPALAPLGSDPGGVMAVITTAGYNNPGPHELPRIKPFLKKVDAVVTWYRSLDGNAAAMLFNAVEARQGMTFSVWKTDPSMIASAYKAGTHGDYLKMHQKEPMFDVSSFTRLRLLASSGTWDGKDPRQEAAA